MGKGKGGSAPAGGNPNHAQPEVRNHFQFSFISCKDKVVNGIPCIFHYISIS